MRDKNFLKFRAWDNEEKWVVDGLYISFDGDVFTDDVKPHDTPYKEIELANAERYEVMQFTGLHDKNGVEIYEGDILYVEQTNVIDPYVPHKKNVSVRYKELDTAFVYDDEVGMAIGLYTAQEEIEVIGNKFEHPHLLEGVDE